MREIIPPSDVSRPVVHGLVLVGGRGSRLGQDKGALDYHGLPQARWALQLLGPFCARCFLSGRSEQAETAVYRGLPMIVDEGVGAGPGGGVLAALRRFPSVAWLVMAADMPLLDSAWLAKLLERRDPAALATAYRRRDGVPEPLCALWEPAAKAPLERQAMGGDISLRRALEAGPARLLDVEDDGPLTSVNTPEDDARVRRLLSTGAAVM
jgi:molybdopterin-guanine dinucleotide biosynthesis protein A